ncbi:MAG TPA: ribokinase [Candidatus Angelobacter sp.]|nr:ribokinase [Candidatus Angelobacter sp.]
MSGLVCVVGSVNVDLVVSVDHLPAPGETVPGGRFAIHDGGKGANAAVAAARAGARLCFIGAVGQDDHGRRAAEALSGEGIDLTGLHVSHSEPTGVALIVVGPRGENQIAVAPGANHDWQLSEADRARIAQADVLLTNLEVPLGIVVEALRIASGTGATSILNPAPAHALPAEVLRLGPILTPNEHELTVAIGNDESGDALADLARRHAGPIIVTQGAAGALLVAAGGEERFAGRRAAEVVDTTGAGDTFNGVLAAWLAAGADLADAVRAANVAASMSVGTAGARAGMPQRDAILAELGLG